jgi:predicted transcriptional regulator
MKDSLRAAINLVEAQASLRSMLVEEIVSMLSVLSASLESASLKGPSDEPAEEKQPAGTTDGIRLNSIVCLECGAKFKVLSAKHLARHGMTADEYRAKWGMKKRRPLAAKSLTRLRREKMNEMRLWEKKDVRKKIREGLPA